MAAKVVIMIGRKRSSEAWRMASRLVQPCDRSASMAKSMIMIAFFLTMPISSTTPIMAMMLNSVLKMSNAATAPTPADGRVESTVRGWM